MRTPRWLHEDDVRDPFTERLDEAGERLRRDVAAERLRIGSLGTLPLDKEQAAFELSSEQRARLNSRPRTRRWKQLDKIDRQLDELQQRQSDATARLHDAETRVQQAPTEDARTLAAWLAAGEKGDRPAATLPECVRGRDAARLLVEAITVELDRALEHRREFIERHRERMVSDACKDVDAARRRLLDAARALPALREELLACRETLEWVVTFPEPAETYGYTDAVALGLLAPVKQRLGTTARIPYHDVVAVLEDDAAALAETHARSIQEKLGTAPAPTPLTTAMWDSEVDPGVEA
jgi:hypothetical protein